MCGCVCRQMSQWIYECTGGVVGKDVGGWMHLEEWISWWVDLWKVNPCGRSRSHS